MEIVELFATGEGDCSKCFGFIAFAIAKERINRHKHSTGFYHDVIDYCLRAEGIVLDDVDLVVRNCYVLPVGELEKRLTYQDVPEVLPPKERKLAIGHPLFRSRSGKVVDISHHLAHAYSAFAVCPFNEGALMVVDGVGSYAADVAELGLDARTLGTLLDRRAVLVKRGVDATELDGEAPHGYRTLWGDWVDREEELYRACAERVRDLTWSQALAIAGGEARAAFSRP